MLPPFVDEILLDSVAQVESAGNSRAISPRGAKGLFQLMDATGKEWHKKLKIVEEYDPFNPAQARMIAGAYLEDLYSQFHKPELAVGAYNCGPGRMFRAMKMAQATTWPEISPFCPPETRTYVERVDKEYGRRGKAGTKDKLRWLEGITQRLSSEKDFTQPRSDVSVGVGGQNAKENMIDKIKQFLTGVVAKSVVRKLMVLLSGVLLGIGIDPTIVSQFVSSGTEVLIAVALYGVAQIWSIIEKKAEASK